MRNHTPVFHYIERRIIIIHERVRRALPVGIEEIPIVDVTIRAHINHIVVADEVRRAKPPKLFGQKLVYFRRNLMYNHPIRQLLMYKHNTHHYHQSFPEMCDSRRNLLHTNYQV